MFIYCFYLFHFIDIIKAKMIFWFVPACSKIINSIELFSDCHPQNLVSSSYKIQYLIQLMWALNITTSWHSQEGWELKRTWQIWSTMPSTHLQMPALTVWSMGQLTQVKVLIVVDLVKTSQLLMFRVKLHIQFNFQHYIQQEWNWGSCCGNNFQSPESI